MPKSSTDHDESKDQKPPARQNSAFMKPLKPSPALAAVLGSQDSLPRSEVVKQIWAYIRKHELQNPNNKRNIRADAKLRPVFGGRDEVTMFELNKHLAQHLS